MATHLAHKLPWSSLSEVFKHLFPRQKDYTTRRALADKHRKTIEHFALCLTGALAEFAASDTSTEEERDEFDAAKTWDADAEFRGANMGYFTSIIYGYLELNMILVDPEVFTPFVLGGQSRHYSWTMKVLCDECDGGHPEWLAANIRQVFENRELKPLTGDVLQIMRNHCALLFRCMFSISGPNYYLDPKCIANKVEDYIFFW